MGYSQPCHYANRIYHGRKTMSLIWMELSSRNININSLHAREAGQVMYVPSEQCVRCTRASSGTRRMRLGESFVCAREMTTVSRIAATTLLRFEV